MYTKTLQNKFFSSKRNNYIAFYQELCIPSLPMNGTTLSKQVNVRVPAPVLMQLRKLASDELRRRIVPVGPEELSGQFVLPP